PGTPPPAEGPGSPERAPDPQGRGSPREGSGCAVRRGSPLCAGGPALVLLSPGHFGEGEGAGPSVIDAVRNRELGSLCPVASLIVEPPTPRGAPHGRGAERRTARGLRQGRVAPPARREPRPRRPVRARPGPDPPLAARSRHRSGGP